MSYAFTSTKTRELFEIAPANWQEEHTHLSDLRRVVFVEEQGVSADEEWDGLDPEETTQHFRARKINYNADNLEPIVATARVLPDGKIGRMCVHRDYRNQGIGKALLQEILCHLIEQEFEHVYLYAQLSAKAFYETLGFIPSGEPFIEAGIEHIRMELALTEPESLPSIYEDRVLRLSNTTQFERHLRQLTALGRYSLDIMSHTLNPLLYSQQVTDEISRLARNHRQAQVRILVEDTKTLIGVTHPLVQLSQRLSSSVSIKRLNNGPDMGKEAFAIIDKSRMLYFNDESTWEGFARYYAAAECEHQLQDFEHLWQTYGVDDPDLNRLYL